MSDTSSELALLTHATVRATTWDVAVLPFGATEPHNLHLPYGTDAVQVESIARAAVDHAARAGGRVLLLPTIPFGVNTNHLRVPGAVTISLNPTTLLAVLRDVVDSLERQGVRKLLLLNGHGGNELKPLCRELHHRTPVHLFVCDWFTVARDLRGPGNVIERAGEHADELETSLMLHLRPDLVHMDQAGPGRIRPTRFEAVNRGWVSITRPWHLLTDDTGVGDPSAATADKGRQVFDTVTTRIGQFLTDLARSPLDETFPF